jgi:hypothetical protein
MRLIARGEARELERCEEMLRDQGIDALLDDPRLLDTLLTTGRGAHASFTLFAYVAVRHALREVGEESRALADYVASVLVAFGDHGRAERASLSDDERYDTLAELIEDANGADPRRSFLVRAHVGNYALWKSGLFPDFIEHRRWRKGGPDIGYYDEMGKRGFQLAADHRLAEQHGMRTLYATAATRFEVLRAALNNLSDRLLFPNVHTPERLMRQVATGALLIQ